jgi:hypothetical protein
MKRLPLRPRVAIAMLLVLLPLLALPRSQGAIVKR